MNRKIVGFASLATFFLILSAAPSFSKAKKDSCAAFLQVETEQVHFDDIDGRISLFKSYKVFDEQGNLIQQVDASFAPPIVRLKQGRYVIQSTDGNGRTVKSSIFIEGAKINFVSLVSDQQPE